LTKSTPQDAVVDEAVVQDEISEDLAALAEQLKEASLRMHDLVTGDKTVHSRLGSVPLYG
jgi:hypothetical protein